MPVLRNLPTNITVREDLASISYAEEGGKHMLVMLLTRVWRAAPIGEQQLLESEAGEISNGARWRHTMQVKTRNLGSSEQLDRGMWSCRSGAWAHIEWVSAATTGYGKQNRHDPVPGHGAVTPPIRAFSNCPSLTGRLFTARWPEIDKSALTNRLRFEEENKTPPASGDT